MEKFRTDGCVSSAMTKHASQGATLTNNVCFVLQREDALRCALPLDAGSLNCPHPLGKCSILRRPVKGARNWRRVCDPPEYSCIGPLIRQARERARNNAKHKINPRASVGIRDGLIGVDKRNTSTKRRSNRTRLAGFGSVRSKGSGMARMARFSLLTPPPRPYSRISPPSRKPAPLGDSECSSYQRRLVSRPTPFLLLPQPCRSLFATHKESRFLGSPVRSLFL